MGRSKKQARFTPDDPDKETVTGKTLSEVRGKMRAKKTEAQQWKKYEKLAEEVGTVTPTPKPTAKPKKKRKMARDEAEITKFMKENPPGYGREAILGLGKVRRNK